MVRVVSMGGEGLDQAEGAGHSQQVRGTMITALYNLL